MFLMINDLKISEVIVIVTENKNVQKIKKYETSAVSWNNHTNFITFYFYKNITLSGSLKMFLTFLNL